MKLKYILLFFILLPFLQGCNHEDDINVIFSGGWKLNNFYTTTDWTNNHKSTPKYSYPKDKAILDQIKQDGKFIINFSESNFTGVADEKTFSGTWRADGKKSTASIVITSGGSSSNPIGREFIEALKNARFYSGDVNYLQLYSEKKDTYIQFRRER